MDGRQTSSGFLSDFNFAKLVAPVGADTFFADHWEDKPLLIRRGEPDFYGDLLTLSDFDREAAFSPRSLKTADNLDQDKPRGASTTSPVGAAELIVSEVESGGTLILDGLHQRAPNLALLCRLMSAEFGHRFQTNIYLTPPGGKGFKAHYDTHDVFVLQILGDKAWRLETERRCVPRGKDHDQVEMGDARDEFTLGQGDLLYIPRGFVHDAQSGDDTTMHCTLGLLPATWEELMLGAIRLAAEENEDLKRALPPGFLFEPPDRLAEGLAQRFSTLALPASAKASARRFADEYVSTFGADVSGFVNTFFGGRRQPALDDAVGVRRGLIYRLAEGEGSVVVLVGKRRIEFPDFLDAALRHALDTERFAIRDIPGDFEDDEKLVFIQRLLQEGFVEFKED